MNLLKITGLVIGGVLLVFVAWLIFAPKGPGEALIRSAMEDEVKRHMADATLSNLKFIRADSFVPASHRDFPAGTAFYPIRVEATYSGTQGDGPSGPDDMVATFFFYKSRAGQWAYEVNSF